MPGSASGRATSRPTVLLTDCAWPNVAIEASHHRPDVILTPHIAFSSDASLRDVRRNASEEVVRVLRGERPRQARNEPQGH